MTRETLYRFSDAHGGRIYAFASVNINGCRISLGRNGQWLTRFNPDGTQTRKAATPDNLELLTRFNQSMSLDVYLTGENREVSCTCPHCDNVHTRTETEQFYDSNITHNLNQMAKEAGIYEACWRPEEIGITKAKELIEPLRAGLALMVADPQRFEKHNAKNGWGLYKHFVSWVRKYLAACEQHPEANVKASR